MKWNRHLKLCQFNSQEQRTWNSQEQRTWYAKNYLSNALHLRFYSLMQSLLSPWVVTFTFLEESAVSVFIWVVSCLVCVCGRCVIFYLNYCLILAGFCCTECVGVRRDNSFKKKAEHKEKPEVVFCLRGNSEPGNSEVHTSCCLMSSFLSFFFMQIHQSQSESLGFVPLLTPFPDSTLNFSNKLVR